MFQFLCSRRWPFLRIQRAAREKPLTLEQECIHVAYIEAWLARKKSELARRQANMDGGLKKVQHPAHAAIVLPPAHPDKLRQDWQKRPPNVIDPVGDPFEARSDYLTKLAQWPTPPWVETLRHFTEVIEQAAARYEIRRREQGTTEPAAATPGNRVSHQTIIEPATA